MGTQWADGAVWFTNIMSSTVYLPLIAFNAVGLPVFGHYEGFGWQGFSVLGVILLCVFWISLHYSLAVLINRIFYGKT